MIFKKNQPTGELKSALKSPSSSTQTPTSSGTLQGKGPKTKVIIKYDVGYANDLYIRGKGANLNWDKGLKLKNLKHDEWVWETDVPFSACEFKVLINDRIYETGTNHTLNSGSAITYSPRF